MELKSDTNVQELTFDDINIGDVSEFSHTFTEKDSDTFSKLSGDFNPLHTDASFGSKSEFGKIIVHGMFIGSLFSRLIGMYCPGINALYIKQTLNFRKPVHVGDSVSIRGTVIKKVKSMKAIVLKTEVFRRKEVVVDGEATAKVRV